MTPEAAAEEMYPISEFERQHSHIGVNSEHKRIAFIAGHKSRDPEVERLVEALRELIKTHQSSIEYLKWLPVPYDNWFRDLEELNKAKEALKQYQP